ncbi:hypothetical protein K402DRAFT_326001 [Aulographum hederae CBS 113979]|uniref:G-protein coupled receptors family 2 profile 2 domain-containing protein n=1 Tax=Aulographum hederae CBS 113979 TaxID=1176131 RepID=A0A6G1H9C6_9PEZI|nr:hypothetical protein K402DRAFT_326001 [Aulographum hederae CBS 113979]
MNNITLLRGRCPSPFLDHAKFNDTGGFIPGRFCAPMTPDLTCCLPCPATDYVYPDDFTSWYRASEWVNVASLVFLLILLITITFVHKDYSKRTYLSTCLIIAVAIESLGFAVGLATKPNQCFNEITPNDMYTSMSCAWSGALICCGGLAISTWLWFRALTMHLTIVWDRNPGDRFFYYSQLAGWGVTGLFFTLTICLTGVSFRFGDACHVNSKHSMIVFWGPLLAIAGSAAIMQFSTLAYCVNVFLRNIWSDEPTEDSHSASASATYYSESLRTHSAGAVYKRIRIAIFLQWRSIILVVFILGDVIFFSIVFVYFNRQTQSITKDLSRIRPWVSCLIEHGGDKTDCYTQAEHAFVSEAIVTAVLVLLGIAGIQTFLLQARWTMIRGWIEFFRKFVGRSKHEFVSLDAKQSKGFELTKIGSPIPLTNMPRNPSIQSPVSVYSFRDHKTSDFDTDLEQQLAASASRAYHTPSMSFSHPRAHSGSSGGGSGTVSRLDWDTRNAEPGRGGLNFHPPSVNDEDYDRTTKNPSW